MERSLLVATRKGLITYGHSNGRWRLARTDFLGEPVTMVLRDPRDDSLYAALRLGHFGPKLRRSRDGGESWQEISMPAYAPAADGRGPSVDMIWSLEPGGADRPGRLWAGTIPGGLFLTEDGGESWQLIESLWERAGGWFGGGYDQPGIHSICVDPRDSRRVRVGVSTGGVWYTEDDGESWVLRAQGMRAAYMPPEQAYEPGVQDVHRLVACPADPERLWAQHHNGIFRSVDGGVSWAEIESAQPSSFGFAAAVHPRDPDMAWFVPAVKDEYRVPVDQRLVVTRTRDGGRSFEALGEGLPQVGCFDLVYRHGLEVDADGQCLAMGSTTGNLWFSADQGEFWEEISSNLPPIYAVRL